MDDDSHKQDHQFIERRAEGNRRRVLELVDEVNNLSIRLHRIEDHFITGGVIDELTQAVALLSMELERIHNERRLGNA